MPVSLHSAGSRVLLSALALALAVAPGTFGKAPPRFASGETVNVEVKIVPFYAVDADGRAVTDLRRDEIELRVGGAPVPVESFDRYASAPGAAGAPAASPSSPPSPAAPIPSRNVFFLFDTVFSSAAAFHTDKTLAARMLASWPAGDHVSLLVNGSAGMESRLGPVAAAGEGKRRLLAAIEDLNPEVRRVGMQYAPEEDFGPNGERASRAGRIVGGFGIPQEQVHAAWDGLQGNARGEYMNIAKSYASSLGALAAELRGLPGPKVLAIFSQGLNYLPYFEGDNGTSLGLDDSVLVDTRRSAPLLDRFRVPMAALAESGTMSMFVNTQRFGPDADAPLRDMAKNAGGLYFTGDDAGELGTRIAGSTAAYYEAGFRPSGPALAASHASVEVVVRRPGVRAWAPASVRMWEPYRELSVVEKRQMVVDLVVGGPGSQSAHSPVRLKLQELGGKVVGQAASGHPRLKLEAAWPASSANRKLDFYNVLLAPPGNGQKGQVLAFDHREGTAADRPDLEATLDGEGARVWGILAVDPETEQAWVRRLMLRAPGRGSK
ncbi:MAG TPA: hypothetical protein VGH73_01675 [Thermoanaerobaculia bacterium]